MDTVPTPAVAWTSPWMPRFKKRRLHGELVQDRGYYAQISPKSELRGFKWGTLTTNVSMTLCSWQIRHQTHVLCGCTTFVPNQIRDQINTVPMSAVVWTRVWLLQVGGGATSTDEYTQVFKNYHVGSSASCPIVDPSSSALFPLIVVCHCCVGQGLRVRSPVAGQPVSGRGSGSPQACRSILLVEWVYKCMPEGCGRAPLVVWRSHCSPCTGCWGVSGHICGLSRCLSAHI